MIGEALAVRSHNVTIFSPYLVKNPPKGVQYIFIGSKKHAIEDYTQRVLIRNKKQNELLDFFTLAWLTDQMCQGILVQSADKIPISNESITNVSNIIYVLFY